MTDISVFGAGAFGTALAISLARNGHAVQLIARNHGHARAMRDAGQNALRLEGFCFPDKLSATTELHDPALICLLAMPAQELAGFLGEHRQQFVGRTLVACCKGIDQGTGLGPTGTILAQCPTSEAAILSGPGFAIDIAAGLPTALTVAARSENAAQFLQTQLSGGGLRLYRTTDTTGVELGGALKNVIAIAAGVAIGAGLGESARAALMTRGYDELKRFALAAGALPETLSGLSGFGDLVLTCTSEKSRNYRHGIALGSGAQSDESATVEGVATAKAVDRLATTQGIELPVTSTVVQLLSGGVSVQDAVQSLLSRPLKKE